MADEQSSAIQHVPQHPLPEEIRKMQRDETVCKFCGVSYLIHNEIKALEDKLKAIEKELAHYKGCEQRELKLQEQLSQKEKEIGMVKQTLTEKDTSIQSLMEELESKTKSNEEMTKKLKELEEQCNSLSVARDLYKSKHSLLMKGLPTISLQVHKWKEDLCYLKENSKKQIKSLSEDCSYLNVKIQNMCSKQDEDLKTAKAKVQILEKEKMEQLHKENELMIQLQHAKTENEKLKKSANKANTLELEYVALKNKLQALENNLHDLEAKNRQQSMEAEQYKQQLMAKNEEIERTVSQTKLQVKMIEQSNFSLEKELHEKEATFLKTKDELHKLRRELSQQKNSEEEIMRKAAMSHGKTEELKEVLERVKGDLEAMKKEREMMIIAHQNQIEQLRQSFKTRILDADKWAQKVDDAVRNERLKSGAEIQALEAKLKESFVMELQIEKQKHQKLLDKHNASIKDQEGQLQKELNEIRSMHKKEISDLHKQIGETKARNREQEETLRSEISSLKGIIRELENRLGKLDNGNDRVVGELKLKSRKLETEIESMKEGKRKLETQLTAAHEEAQLLQDTVRRECEERFELTEALAEAKEELLAMKKPPGGYSSKNANASDGVNLGKSESARSRIGTEEMMLFKKVNHPHPPKRSENTASPLRTESVSSSTYSHPNENSKPSTRGLKGNTLSDSRKRIAFAVGRK